MARRAASRLYGRVAARELGLLAVIACLTLSPLVAIFVMSFDISPAGRSFEFGLRGWRALVSEAENYEAALASLLLSLRVPVGMALALVVAWLLVRVRVPGHRIFEYGFWFAYFLPTLPMLSGWVLLLDADFGLLNDLFDRPVFDIRTPMGIIWVHLSLQTVPTLVILLIPALRMIDRSLESAALVSGAGARQVFFQIVLPLALPALLLAGLAGWIKALESFEVEQILGGTQGYYVISSKIYDYVSDERPRLAEAMAFSMVFLVLLVILGLFYQWGLARRGRVEVYGGTQDDEPTPYSRLLRVGGTAFVGLFLAVTMLLPFAMLICGSFMRLFGFFAIKNVWTLGNWEEVVTSSEFLNASWSTFTLGVSTALPGAIFFAFLAWGISGLRGASASAASILVWIPWSFPGIVLGLGLLELTLKVPGLTALRGTLLPLVLGLLIREVPLGVHMMRTSISQTSRDLVDAARVAGASPLRVFSSIVLPANLPALTVVFLLIFAGVISDVGTIILIAPPGVQTLSLMTFKYMSLSNFEAATVVGTIMALFALAVSILAYKVSAGFERANL